MAIARTRIGFIDLPAATALFASTGLSTKTYADRICRVIKTKRVYEPHATTDGARFLVERLWPRGIAKAALEMDGWLKDVAPSTELRRWFDHDPQKWAEFKRRYVAELAAHADAWKPILTKARRGRVTLLYSAHDVEHNNAVVLRDFLNHKLESRPKKP